MKKCPTCQKTFDDNLRFCQVDGTPLVDDAPPMEEPAFDPYATIVGTAPPIPKAEEPAPQPEPEAVGEEHLSVSALPISEPDDVLELPQSDPLKTMYASDAEMKEILGSAGDAAAPPAEAPVSEPEPTFAPAAPEPPPPPSFADMAPPPSPFSQDESSVDLQPVAPPSDMAPASPAAFDEAATMIQSDAPSAFTPEPAAPVEQWTPPPAPEPSWQNQPIGSNTPMQPPPPGVGGQSQGLAIASLVCGIASLLCCNWFVVGLAAVIMGFIARGKATSDPANYTGGGLALGGMITGGVSLILGVIVWILYFLGFAASILQGR